MIDITEELLSVDDAAPLLRVGPTVVQDYIRRGRRGVHLEATVIGGRAYTTREAINDYCRRWAEARVKRRAAATIGPAEPHPAPRPSKAALRAERDLKKLGF